ncbi:hypothetical protein EKO23_01240 [Nocardioides guangzhouensis]|uniref:Integral membrane protein n=1 Tax=Nocardioides guangzhouensis TaxID=2497878 RepID=A0A4V1Y056_9ACTN|nr:hypothetical protein [Nocardioides guangzhouensis]RYP89079.1 hypothetical protein EKO23_01240 [Nocardioides guangzhouensis]
MENRAVTRKAAIGATVGFAGLAAFQLLLAAGVPWGDAAWGGTDEGRLAVRLRIGSGLSVAVYAVAVSLVLRRAGFPVRGVSAAAAGIGTWALVVLMTLGTVANLLSESPWERFVLGPVTLVLVGLCLVVARAEESDSVAAP